MNFFSHFMVDHQIHRPNFNVGLIAPDLLRNFTPKHCKFHFAEFQQQTSNHSHPNNPALHDFFSGCLQHIDRDKEFHQSAFFEEAYQTIRESWRNTCLEFNIPKYWFSLHVLIEMMLDKYFIDNNLEKLELFYHQLTAQTNTYEIALNAMNHPSAQTFMDRYQIFCEKQYLFHYQNIQRVAYALHRVYDQIGIRVDWYHLHENQIVGNIEAQFKIIEPLCAMYFPTSPK